MSFRQLSDEYANKSLLLSPQCNNPKEYSRRMRVLGEYHVHKWGDDEVEACGFHESRANSCNCGKDKELQCDGKPHKTKTPLPCDKREVTINVTKKIPQQ